MALLASCVDVKFGHPQLPQTGPSAANVKESNLGILNLGLQAIRKICTMSSQWRYYRVKEPARRVRQRFVRRQLELARTLWMPANYLLVENMRRFSVLCRWVRDRLPNRITHHFHAQGGR